MKSIFFLMVALLGMGCNLNDINKGVVKLSGKHDDITPFLNDLKMAVKNSDFKKFADLSKFPLPIKRTLDSHGSISVSKDVFASYFEAFLHEDSGAEPDKRILDQDSGMLEIAGESLDNQEYLIKSVDDFDEETALDEKEIQIGPILAMKVNNAWRIVRIYSDVSFGSYNDVAVTDRFKMHHQ
jgi:hypothetical protein